MAKKGIAFREHVWISDCKEELDHFIGLYLHTISTEHIKELFPAFLPPAPNSMYHA